MEKRSDEVWRKLYIHLYCSWHRNAMLLCQKYSRTLSVPKMLFLWKGCKSTWELAAVKESLAAVEGINGGGAWPVSLMGFCPSCWTWHFRSCERVVDTFLPMVVLPFRKMVPPLEQRLLTATHSGLGSLWYECHLLGDEHTLYKLCIIYIYIFYICIHTYTMFMCMLIYIWVYGFFVEMFLGEPTKPC